ncbi:MAG: hypothetical protein WCH11_07755, partial [Bdellovibrio sp.]
METPDQIPAHTPASSLDAALAQNEDLMSRLKVTLKRLELIEQENMDLREDHQSARQIVRHLEDQLSIWKEKERLWVLKKNQLEEAAQISREQSLETRALLKQISRLQKFYRLYQKSIKPAFLQLKAYCDRLGKEIRSLRNENEGLRIKADQWQVESRKRENSLIEEKNRLQSEILELRGELEQERQQNSQMILHYQASEQKLLRDAQKVPGLLIEMDQVQNQVIALRRERDDMIQRNIDLVQRTEADNVALKSDQLRKIVLIDDFKLKIAHLESRLRASESSNQESQHQLNALRELWNTKSEDF